MPPSFRTAEEESQTTILSLITTSKNQSSNDKDVCAQIAEDATEWLVGYLSKLLRPLEEAPLWDVWYTGLSPFPSELVNPSVRASILSGLLRPNGFVEQHQRHDENFSGPDSLWELPDTSILFRRYLDSGKMINVYDWFGSFRLVLDMQRRGSRKIYSSKERNQGNRVSPRGQGSPQLGETEVDDEETWKSHVQARFMRALHELDYLGFVKHTGRKADHVLKTVFDVDDGIVE